jgi:hypothetical protein
LSAESCTELAREILFQLRDAGTELVKAGYLDLSGEAWGCTVACVDGSSLIVTLIPQALGQARSESNPLRVSVVHILVPEL